MTISAISTNYILFAAAILSAITSILVILVLYVKRKTELQLRDRYDFNKHNVELEYIRKNLELQIYDLNKKIEENSSRWKDVNHLIITSQNKIEDANSRKSEIEPNAFLKDIGLNSNDYNIDNNQVFVLTPFIEDYSDTFLTIKQTCSKLNLNCIRGDEQFIPGEIFPVILKEMVKSRFVIANITGRNPNVMYELGIAHALGKPTIIVAQNLTDLPFDLNNKRMILFNNSEDLQNKRFQKIFYQVNSRPYNVYIRHLLRAR